MKFRKINKALITDGWSLVRVLGSNYRYHKFGMNPITVPNYNEQDIPISVIKDIEKKTGLSLRR